MYFHDSSPLILGEGGLKISDQNNWRGPEQKIKLGGELNLRGGAIILGGLMTIAGKGGDNPLFLDQPPFSKISPF